MKKDIPHKHLATLVWLSTQSTVAKKGKRHPNPAVYWLTELEDDPSGVMLAFKKSAGFDLTPYFLHDFEVLRLVKISKEIEKINARIPKHTKDTLRKMVEALPDDIDVPPELVKQIVACMTSPGKPGGKKLSETLTKSRARVAYTIMAFAEKKGKKRIDALQAISAIWGEKKGKTDTDKEKEIKKILKNSHAFDFKVHVALEEFSDDEIKSMPLPETVEEYKKLKAAIAKKYKAWKLKPENSGEVIFYN